MKRFFKGLSVVCLALIMLCPLALAGCAKNHTINIQIAEGEGYVYLKDVEAHSVLGNNTVESGEKFEYLITPESGYKISKIVKDGVEVENFDTYRFYDYFDKVDKNHNVKVYFEKDIFAVNFYCVSAGNAIELFKSVNVVYGESINLNQTVYGGEKALWYFKDGNAITYLYNGLDEVTTEIPEGYEDSNILFVFGNRNVYCDYTAQELIAMGVVR